MARSWELPWKEFQDAVFLLDFKGYLAYYRVIYVHGEKNNKSKLKNLPNAVFPVSSRSERYIYVNARAKKLLLLENSRTESTLSILIIRVVIGTNYCIVRNTLSEITFVFTSTNPFSPYSRIYIYISSISKRPLIGKISVRS